MRWWPTSGCICNRSHWGAPPSHARSVPVPARGGLDERGCSAYVRECWVVHQLERDVEVLSLADGRVAEQRRFAPRGIIQSLVLPELRTSMQTMLGER